MQPNETMMRARNLFLELLLFLANGESCWYTIDGGADEYSLYRRLGFFRKDEYHAFLIGTGLASTIQSEKNKKLQINRDEWNNLFMGYKSKLEVDKTKLDWKNAMKGLKQETSDKVFLSVIRIGEIRRTEINEDEDDQIGWSHKNLGQQLKRRSKGAHQPPPVSKHLSSRQRSFRNAMREMCTDIMSLDLAFFNHDVDDDYEDDDDAIECEEQLDDKCTEPPTKKAKPNTVLHSLECREDGIVDEDEVAEFLSKLPPKICNSLFAQMMKKKHEESNDSYAFSYKNAKNNKGMQYVRVPQNKLDENDESFMKLAESHRFQLRRRQR